MNINPQCGEMINVSSKIFQRKGGYSKTIYNREGFERKRWYDYESAELYMIKTSAKEYFWVNSFAF